MKNVIRDPTGAAGEIYDLIIIGGGIYGVMLSFEASKRGLKSLLLEKDEFGRATSSNSLRIIHGGLRYLQHLDLSRFRESVAERSWFLKTFPDLVKPLPCLMPLYDRGFRRPFIFDLALRMNDFLSRHRNLGISGKSILPDSRIISNTEIKEICKIIDLEGLQGGAIWHDAIMLDSEKILADLLGWSCENGACALNYVKAEKLLLDGKNVKGAYARDIDTGKIHQFKAGVVINASGPWSRDLAAKFDRDFPKLFIGSIAWNVLFNKSTISSYALAITSVNSNSQTYFLIPYKGNLLAGTGHAPWTSDRKHRIPNDEMLNHFINDLNDSIPLLDIHLDDVQRIFSGLLPVKKSGSVNLTNREVIINHESHGGPSGLYSVSGIKFTTSRLVAEKTLDQIFPFKKPMNKNLDIIFRVPKNNIMDYS